MLINARAVHLVVVCGAVFSVLGWNLLASGHRKKPVTSYSFPTTVPLPGWQPLRSQPLATTKKVLSGKHYRFKKNNLGLDIKMRYMDDASYEGIRSIIRQNTARQAYSSSQPILFRHQPGMGYYGLYSDNQQSSLSSCINARGGSTVTPSQFHRNRWQNDLQLSRITLWLIGRSEIWDHRRLCTHLSIPLTHTSPEEANRLLEAAWFSWYPWWRREFP